MATEKRQQKRLRKSDFTVQDIGFTRQSLGLGVTLSAVLGMTLLGPFLLP